MGFDSVSPMLSSLLLLTVPHRSALVKLSTHEPGDVLPDNNERSALLILHHMRCKE